MASTYLSKTLPDGHGGVYKWTYSFWVKRSALGEQVITGARFSGSFNGIIKFTSGDALEVYDYRNSFILQKITSRLFRDTNAWYHIVVSNDNSVSSPETEIYVNGIKETSFSTTNEYSQNETTSFNNDYPNYIGQTGASSQYFDGSMSHVHFIDGTAYDASAFGETDATTGEWKIKTDVSVTYGTNGFFILKDGNSVTDQSGNSNNFTVGGGTLTNTEDNPSNVFCTLNPLDNYYPNSSFANGNTYVATAGSRRSYNTGTIGASSGKYYWEVKCVSNVTASNGCYIGIASTNPTNDGSSSAQPLGYKQYDYSYATTGNLLTNNSQSSYGNTYGDNDIIGVAMDLDNNKLYFSKNSTWQNSGDPTSGSTGTGAISIQDPSGTVNGVYTPGLGDWWINGFNVAFNFGNGYFATTAVSSAGTNASGNGIFEYDVPTGYTALSTKGLNL